MTETEEAREALAALEARISRAAAGRRRDELGLAHVFPALPGGEAPKTLVWVGLDAAAQRVRVETAHCYPNDGLSMYSETRIDAARGAR